MRFYKCWVTVALIHGTLSTSRDDSDTVFGRQWLLERRQMPLNGRNAQKTI